MKSARILTTLAAWVAVAACGDPNATREPSPDAGASDSGAGVVAPPLPPVLEPCPAGWSAIAGPHDVVVCEPFGDGDGGACADDESRFVGEPACSPIGPACPAGDWPSDLPAGASVLYVRAGGRSGASGSTSDPFGTIGEALARAPAGTTIAIARGVYDEAIDLRTNVTLAGACVAETVLAGTADPSRVPATLTVSGGEATVRNLQVRGTGPGIAAGAGTTLVVENVLVSGAEAMGVTAVGGGRITGRSLVVRDTLPDADGFNGVGLAAFRAGRIELARVVVERSHTTGVWSYGASSVLRVEDLAITDTREQPGDGGSSGYGLYADDGGEASIARAAIERNRGAGVRADALARLRLEDVVVRDTLPQLDDSGGGSGVVANAGAELDATRVLVRANRTTGIAVAGFGAIATLRDIVVEDTQSRESNHRDGIGVLVVYGAAATIERAVIAGNRFLGLGVALDGASLALSDVVVSDTMGEEDRGLIGYGLDVDEGSVTGARLLIERSRQFGLVAMGPAASAALEDVTVRETLPADCATTGCESSAGGIGVSAVLGGYVALTRFLVTRNSLCGVQVGRSGDEIDTDGIRGVDLAEGEISENPIGANVQDPTFDFARLSADVSFRDNQRAIDADELPVPESALPSP